MLRDFQTCFAQLHVLSSDSLSLCLLWLSNCLTFSNLHFAFAFSSDFLLCSSSLHIVGSLTPKLSSRNKTVTLNFRYFVWQFYPSNGLMLGPRHLHRAQWSFLPCLATWLTSDSSANPTMSSSASSSKLRTAEDDAGFCLCWGCWRCWAGWTIPQRLPTWLAPEEEDLQVFLFLEAWRPGAVMHHRSPKRFMKCS